MSEQDNVWDYAYTQALLLWLSKQGFTPDTIPAIKRRQVIERAREYATRMADFATEELLTSKAGGSVLHLLFDREATEVLDFLRAFTGMSAGDVVKNSIAIYEWLRQRLVDDEAVTITREMCPHLAPKPAKPHLTLV